MRTVTSRQNPLAIGIRELAGRPDTSGRRLLLDGAHLVADARSVGAHVEAAVIASSRMASATEERRLAEQLHADGVDVVQVPDAVFDSMSPVRSPSGILAVVLREPVTLEELCAPSEPVVLIVVDVQDPGNVGALVRTADAGGASGIVVCGASANPFSWKAVRGSMGSVLRVPVVAGLTTAAAIARVSERGLRLIAAMPREGLDPESVDWGGGVGIVLGGEGAGLPADTVAACTSRVSIPMTPHVESLNVAAAGAILLYVARRRRGRTA